MMPLAGLPLPTAAAADEGPAAEANKPFDSASVRGMARELADKPYRPPDTKLPDPFSKLTYDQYRAIRFDPNRALWHGTGVPFEIQFFHPGFLYKSLVEIYEVNAGQAQPVRYSPDLFDFGELPRPTGEGLGFAGFRVHNPLNRPDYFDEVCAFLGASYFRAVARHQGYGLSARGLAIKTADPAGEEYPSFKAFWIERPQPRSRSLVVHALLDSPSAAASFRFGIQPGRETIFDVESAIYPRTDIAQAGLAPLTSMFFIG
ncbi:MAG: glucan biosynthesis protein, partial [Alphaproteobacteria bacterium]|nr:glucan biosynthesis protein [Alphaproteobacteria bacterium]